MSNARWTEEEIPPPVPPVPPVPPANDTTPKPPPAEHSPPFSAQPPPKTGDALRDLLATLEGRFDGCAVWVHFQGKEFESTSNDLVDAIRLELRDAGVTIPSAALVKNELRLLAAQAKKDAGPEAEQATSDEPAKDPTKTRALLGMLEHLEWFKSPTGRVFTKINGRILASDSKDLINHALSIYRKKMGDVIAIDSVKNVINSLVSDAPEEGEAPIRVGGTLDKIALDTGTDAVVITANSIQHAANAFFRPNGSEPMLFARGVSDDVSTMRELLGPLDDLQWATCVAWMLATWRPALTYPILVIRGEQGSGKSTLAKALRTIVDPRRPVSTAIPKDEENMAILAENCHVMNFDNASAIRGNMSDAMCRLGTGDAMVKREMYSDRDLAVFEASRPIIITSVTDAVTASDLLDRALLVTLPRRARRVRDEEFKTAFAKVVPAFRGMLATAIQSSISRRGTHQISDSIRMYDAADWAIGGEAVMGLAPGAVERAYLASRGVAAGVAGSDPVVELVAEWFGPRSAKWEGTSSKLIDALKKHCNGQIHEGVPRNPSAFSRMLDRHRPTLRAQGIEVGERREGGTGARFIVLERCDGR